MPNIPQSSIRFVEQTRRWMPGMFSEYSWVDWGRSWTRCTYRSPHHSRKAGQLSLPGEIEPVETMLRIVIPRSNNYPRATHTRFGGGKARYRFQLSRVRIS
jgi:hypothetical protein